MTAPARGISQRPYAEHAGDYLLKGWPGIIPVPPDKKWPPPEGFTGADGKYTDIGAVLGWIGSSPGASVALRMPDGLIGIDVDQYLKKGKQKHGAETLAARIAEWGPLPPTWSSTARGPGQPSRIYFFQVPPQRYAGTIDPDIEIIQRHHRYAVAWPSPHHGDDGAVDGTYAWYAPDGSPAPEGVIPSPEDMAPLPDAWVRGLAEGASRPAGVNAPLEAGQQLLLELEGGQAAEAPWCVDMAAANAEARQVLAAAEPGSRHDAMLKYTMQAVMLGAKGHPGYLTAIRALDELWNSLTAGEGRQGEFADMVTGAARSAVTEHGPSPAGQDPCLLMGTEGRQPVQAPAPGPAPGEDPVPVEPPRNWTPYSVIGAHPFETAAELDSVLARDVLARTWPVLRYAADAGSWLVRGPDKWDMRRGDVAKWAVNLVSWLMLPGDPAADDGTPEKAQAKRRARFATNASAGAIAGQGLALVSGGYHPSALEMAGLDAEREILWAGGKPYDLRASLAGPVPAGQVDEGTPHLHSAGVIPLARKTPLWDAFLAAVWPDEEVRAWSLRVLSVAFTGYSDKALPIMLGPTDAGKTSIVDLMMSVLGSYAHVADARLLSAADRSHASIVYALKGRRLSFIDEAPRAGAQATERLKQITGGADLTGNRMAENPVTFSPTHTLILTANPGHEPKLKDAAIRRRVRLIPCSGDPAEVRAARAAIGNLNSPAWRGEAPGVLAAMMAQAALWLDDPASGDNENAPAAGRAAVTEIAEAQDHVLNWVRDECEPWPPGTRSHELFMAFTDSCKRRNIHPSDIPSETAFGITLNELGYEKMKREDANYRPARVRPPQGFMPTAGEFLGTSGGSVKSAGGYTLQDWRVEPAGAQPSSNGEEPGQTIQEPSRLEGMEGSSVFTRTHTRTHTRTQENGDPASRLSSPPGAPQPAEAPEAPAEGPAQPAEDSGEPSQPVADKPARKPRKPKVADPELTGPVLSLPALVMPGGLVIPCPVADAEAMITACGPDLTVDVETTGYPPGHPHYRLRTVQLGNGTVAAVFAADEPEQRGAISRLVAGAGILRAHSAIADLVPLDLDGLVPADQTWPKMHDTVLPAKLADPAMSGSDADGLKDLARDILREEAVTTAADKRRSKVFTSGGWLGDVDATTPPERSGWAMINPACEAMITYAGADVLDTARLAQRLPPAPPAVYERERAAQRICARVGHAGLRLDPARVRELTARETELRETARGRITPYGIGNPGSPQQVAAAFTEMGVHLPRTKPSVKFPQGQPSVKEEVLSRIAAGAAVPEAGVLAGAILDYREHATILSLTLEPFGVQCEHGDGRVRTVIYTLGADTGRMTSRRQNLQQIKREGGYRSCITADPGYLLISADFASVEVRTAAALSQDPALMAMIAAGDACADREEAKNYDLHWRVVRQVYGPDATKSQRYPIKRAVFGHIYGGGAEAMAAGARIPLAAAEAVKASIAGLAPRLTAWDGEMRDYVRKGGREFRAYSGRTIWLPNRIHAAANYCIQGSAREFLVDALLKWEQTPWGGCVILPVHDELIAVVPERDAVQATEALTACMATSLCGVKIAAEAAAPSFAWQDTS